MCTWTRPIRIHKTSKQPITSLKIGSGAHVRCSVVLIVWVWHESVTKNPSSFLLTGFWAWPYGLVLACWNDCPAQVQVRWREGEHDVKVFSLLFPRKESGNKTSLFRPLNDHIYSVITKTLQSQHNNQNLQWQWQWDFFSSASFITRPILCVEYQLMDIMLSGKLLR